MNEHQHPRFVRKVRGDGDPMGLPDGVVLPLFDADAEPPEGWEIVRERADVLVSSPAPGDTRRFGEISEADAVTAVERFMAGESVGDLAQAYGVPVGAIESAIREFATLED